MPAGSREPSHCLTLAPGESQPVSQTLLKMFHHKDERLCQPNTHLDFPLGTPHPMQFQPKWSLPFIP